MMNALQITLPDDKNRFAPGDKIEGRAYWRMEKPPESLEIRLFWYTEGKGTQDVKIADAVRFDAPGRQEERSFNLKLPVEPYSFSGSLISLNWALELVAAPGGETQRLDIVMSPTREEILLIRDQR